MPYIHENDDSRKAFSGAVTLEMIRAFYCRLRNSVMGKPEPVEKKKSEDVEIMLLLRDMARYARSKPEPRIDVNYDLYLKILTCPEIMKYSTLQPLPMINQEPCCYVYGVPVYLKKTEQE